MAYHGAKGFAISSCGPTIGLWASLYRAYATRAQFRWPLYGAILSGAPAEGEVQKGFWDGQKMRRGGREILQGVSSEAKANILHVSRGLAYCSIGMYVGVLIIRSFANVAVAVGQFRDPRLQECNRLFNESMLRDQGRGNKKIKDIIKQTEAKREGRVSSFPREKEQRGRRGGGFEVDDASPTGGIMMDMGGDEEQGRLSGAGDMGGIMSDEQMRTAEAKARPQSPARNRAGTFQMERVERQPNDFGSNLDDAGGSGAVNGGDGRSGGSVWDRIRQQSTSRASDSSTGRGRGMRKGWPKQEESSTAGDGFSVASSEEESKHAREKAQKEFDERVEKERRGGDFSGSARRRW